MVGEVTFAVIGLLFLIADIRTFSSTFQLTFFGQSNTTLAIMATSVFATSFLAPIVGWRLGPKRGVALSAAMLGIATLIAALVRNDSAALAPPLVLVAALLFLAAGVAAMGGGPRTWTRPDARGSLALIALPALFLVA